MCIFHLGNAQASDSTKVRKNLRFSILGGPGYTPDYGIVLGGSALFTFSTSPADSLLKRSVLPVSFAYMTSGGGTLIIKPQLFYNNDRFRIFGKALVGSAFDNYYGVGYKTNSERIRDRDSTEYRSVQMKVNPILMFRYKDSPLFIGGSFDVAHKYMKDPSEGIINDKDYINQGGDSTGLKINNIGIGFNMSFDTRDVPANAYSGLFLQLTGTFYSTILGSSSSFSSFKMDYRQFKQLKFIGERKILAWMINGNFTSGKVPITELSMLGSPFDLRGYYAGQYRDRHSASGIIEYRHMFNFGDATKLRHLASKLGFAIWSGAGAIAPDINKWSVILPNYGAGLRIELQPRMNFRLDVGRDSHDKQTLIYFNMTEAF